jgi:RHS repeat-associated protein
VTIMTLSGVICTVLTGQSTCRSTTYYMHGGARVAFREETNTGEAFYYLHGDHLGSTSVVSRQDKTVQADLRYTPFGEERKLGIDARMRRTYTGQRDEADQYVGSLMDYNARFYVTKLGRFASADTVVPIGNDPQSFNRYAYVRNNPLNRVDPSGHGDCNVHKVKGCNNPDPFHLKFRGKWTSQKMSQVRSAAERTDSRLRMYDLEMAQRAVSGTPLAASNVCRWCTKGEGSAWESVFGKATLVSSGSRDYYKNKAGNSVEYGAITDGPHQITFHTLAMESNDENFVMNTLHEFGHMFAGNASNSSLTGDRRQPYVDIAAAAITDATGIQIAGGTLRTNDGYQLTNGDRLPFQQHGGASGGEDFADMFMNWVQDSFDSDAAGAGVARKSWIENGMATWVNLAQKSNR